MKKSIIALAVLIASSVSFSAFAQCPKAAKCSADSCVTACESVLFEGITLTPDQQTKIKALKESAAKERGEKIKADRTAKAGARKEARKGYLKNMKEILTPDQYVIFLENAYVTTPGGNNGKDFRKGDMRKGDKDMKRPGKKAKDIKGKKAEKTEKTEKSK